VEGSCEHGNELSGSIKCWEVLEQLHNWKLLKKGSAPCVSDRTMDDVQKHNVCINVPSSQTFRSYCDYIVLYFLEMNSMKGSQP
jgi:hypothetical protein